MKKIPAIIVFGALLCFGIFAGALCAASSGYHGGGYHGGYYGGYRGGYYGGWRGGYYGWYGFGPWWGYPYAYPYNAYPYYAYPNAYPYAYPYSTYPDTQLPAPSEPQQSYWYYCQNPQGYYPYVNNCPGGWTQVTPTPPQSGREGVEQ